MFPGCYLYQWDGAKIAGSDLWTPTAALQLAHEVPAGHCGEDVDDRGCPG